MNLTNYLCVILVDDMATPNSSGKIGMKSVAKRSKRPREKARRSLKGDLENIESIVEAIPSGQFVFFII